MVKRVACITLLLIGLLITTAESKATVIISNLNGNDGIQTADITSLRTKAMGFTMAAGTDFALVFATLRLDIFDVAGTDPLVEIRSNDGSNNPGSVLTTLLDPTIIGTGIANYDFMTSSPFTLMGGTTYWLTVSGTGTSGFDWKASSPPVTPTGTATHFGARFSTNALPPTGGSNILNSYSINASKVPEPGTLGLLGLGLAGLAWRLRKLET